MGECFTDPVLHGITKIPGAVQFSLDIRSEDPAVLAEAEALLQEEATRIAARRGVKKRPNKVKGQSPAVRML